jgi:hypothetical protein
MTEVEVQNIQSWRVLLLFDLECSSFESIIQHYICHSPWGHSVSNQQILAKIPR